MVLAEESHLLQFSAKRDNFYPLFQKAWVSSLRVRLHQSMIFDLWEGIQKKGTSDAKSLYLPNAALCFAKEDCSPVHILHFRSKM